MSDAKKTANQPAFGQHKDGSYYLRATSPEQAGAIQDAAEKHGLALSHRKSPALHEGQKGVFSHFHFTDPGHGEKILEELRTLHEAGAAEPADDAGDDLSKKPEGEAVPQAGGETHVHVHLHQGEDAPRGVKKAHVAAHTRTVNGKVIQVQGYDDKRRPSDPTPTIHPKAQAAKEASEKADAISGKEPVDHKAAEEAHSLARTAHLEARGPLGPMGDPESDPHGHAAAHHQERMLHHREAHQTTIHEAIEEHDKKNGIDAEKAENEFFDASERAHKHSKGLEMGGGMAPTAESHYIVHEAHSEAARLGRQFIEAMGSAEDWKSKHPAAWTINPESAGKMVEAHEKDAAWHKFLGDSKMRAREKGAKGRKVAKSLSSYLQSAELLDAAQRWYVGRLNVFNMGKSPADLPAFAAVKEAVKTAAHKGMSPDQVMDAIYMATGGASTYTQAVTGWLNA